MFRSRNYFAAVPQALTPSYTCSFWVYFTLFSHFSLKTSTFSPERAAGTVNRSFFRLHQCSMVFGNATLDLRSTRAPTKKKTEKREKSLFLQKYCFLCSKAFHRVSVRCKTMSLTCSNYSMRKISNFLRTMTHLNDTSGPEVGAFATQFFHIQTS